MLAHLQEGRERAMAQGVIHFVPLLNRIRYFPVIGSLPGMPIQRSTREP
jgi:hypothetical protein